MSETRYCSECNRKTESGESYGRPYCLECGSFYEPKLLAKRKEMIAEIREWHEGKRDSFPQLTVFEAFGVMLDELDKLREERDKLIEGLRWYADEDTHMIKRRSDGDYAPIALDHGKRARDILKEIGVTVE